VLSLIRNAAVFAPESRGRKDVLVAAGRILAIGSDLGAPRGAACDEVDLDGARLIPGLVDAHVHVTGGGGEAGPSTRVPPIMLGALASAGVTSCVGLLGTDTTTRTIESLVARTLGLRAEGLSAWCWTGGYQVPPRTLMRSVRDDIVFVDPIIGVGETAISDHRSSQPTFDEILRLAADCHVAGLMSGKAGILHLHLGDGQRGLDLVRRALDGSEIPARVFHPTHVNRQPRLFEEAMAIANRGVTVDVTAFPDDDSDPAVSATTAIEAWLDLKLPAARLTCSSDGAGCLPVFDGDGQLVAMDVGKPSTLADTLAALLKRRDASDVLPIFTSNVATLLRLPRKGRIAEGADADLVVLDGDGRPRDVMARGRWLVRGGSPVVRGPFEQSTDQTIGQTTGKTKE
jgi:beta-aspartyl-dipeptidase (metallo-type)